jgi:ribosomal protein S18 acetylase RimI-like enzyme
VLKRERYLILEDSYAPQAGCRFAPRGVWLTACEERGTIMSTNLIPHEWVTAHLTVRDSTLDDVPALQRIYEAVPQVRGWMGAAEEGAPERTMRSALAEGALPPNGSQERFRLQSIRLADTGQMIGFLGVYHGFPEADVLWVTVLALHPELQHMGYGQELMRGLDAIVKRLEAYTRMRLYASLKNWPGLRFWTQAGFDQVVVIAGDKVYSDEADAHVMLERSLV